jgi:ferredoxin-NADP reductase
MSDGDILAIVTGLGALISAVAGVVLAIHAARNKERRAYQDEVDQLSGMLKDERDLRVTAELASHRLRVQLARNGIEPERG